MTLPMHRHLADQHLFGLPFAHDPVYLVDRDNSCRCAITGGISLDVDFFHRPWNGAVARARRTHCIGSRGEFVGYVEGDGGGEMSWEEWDACGW